MNASRSTTRLPGLEALRCVAAVCVLLLHARAVFGGAFVFGKGYLGVDFFLMLAGYLMARGQEAKLAQGLSPWRFLVKRYRRLWPMMAAGGIIGLPRLWLYTQGPADWAETAALNLALLPAWWQGFAFLLNIPAWTILAQVLCEAAHVTALWRLGNRALPAVTVLAGSATLWIAHRHGSLDVGARPDGLVAGLARCLFAYLVGIGLSRWWRDTPPLPVPPPLALAAMPALVAASWYWHWQGWWLDPALVVLACPLMLAGGLRLRRFPRLAGLAGQLSFPLFALQMPVLQGLRELHGTYWTGLAAAIATGIAGAFLAGWRARRKASRQTGPKEQTA